ncbi:apoptosis regulatory protein Siva-like [Bombyx mandarina]|uniref:Apoptosis regulatory protein Siva n=2 Tax=Bombyx TaxID=7090 RepID=A0A8R2AS01_BOMMO|nr:apoptosis regulatory protein Siva isoform X1 [Bombyx mori]XP_028036559.1 apoptosis regulatory protein Siva-like [Bombyx mandarina]
MTKRTNPFIDDFLPQSKIHVSLKKYDKHSTDNEKRLKKVYEKTLQMLFNGAKKGTTTETNNNLQDSKVRKDKKKQLFIGKDGNLLHSGCLIETQSIRKNCHCGVTSETKCAYCEFVLCDSCLHTCAGCEQVYCNKCLFVGSEGSEICVSCYS